MPIRSPIATILGHVDVGKTLLLDHIRKTSVQAREAGGLTQHIGASFFPAGTLVEICGPLLEKMRGKIKIPGLLVIDTPGHEIFVNLRKRGGAVADIAILVIDAVTGFQAQTPECIDILKLKRTPFIVAANKIDLITGWRPVPNALLITSYQRQDPEVRRDLDDDLYRIMGDLSSLGFRSDRFDKVKDFTKSVAIVPVSAKTGEGVTELLAVLVGLSQQFLTEELLTTTGPAKGSVLEVKEEVGLGMTIDTIIHDGVIHTGDYIVVGGKEEPITTSVRALLMPKPLDEIRDPRFRFSPVQEVHAAAGVKIVAPNLESGIAGSPVYVVPSESELNKYVSTVREEVEKIRIKTDKIGVVVKADTLGSLEALLGFLSQKDIKVRLADVGDVSKRDVVESSIVKSKEPIYGTILAFNAKVLPDAQEAASERGIHVITENIMYRLADDYAEWAEEFRASMRKEQLEKLVRPGKVQVLKGYIFRSSKPAIFGIKVLAGFVKPKWSLVNQDGVDLGEIMQVQERGEALSEAVAEMEVAISMMRPVVGKNVQEDDVLYVSVPERHVVLLLTKFKNELAQEEIEVLNELIDIMRKKNPLWGTTIKT